MSRSIDTTQTTGTKQGLGQQAKLWKRAAQREMTMNREPQEERLTVGVAAAMIGLAEADIRRAIMNGRLPFVRSCLRYWIDPADLRVYREQP